MDDDFFVDDEPATEVRARWRRGEWQLTEGSRPLDDATTAEIERRIADLMVPDVSEIDILEPALPHPRRREFRQRFEADLANYRQYLDTPNAADRFVVALMQYDDPAAELVRILVEGGGAVNVVIESGPVAVGFPFFTYEHADDETTESLPMPATVRELVNIIDDAQREGRHVRFLNEPSEVDVGRLDWTELMPV